MRYKTKIKKIINLEEANYAFEQKSFRFTFV